MPRRAASDAHRCAVVSFARG
ncbi:hypothetical protein LMA02_07935 [Burkholderia sp. B21-005]|nr:hypothetical protein LMA01_07955 [Burkholderia sp. B21-007]UEP42989.1 hypothetical protein LMA02_07935 [Burkholderia sp. B21-005]